MCGGTICKIDVLYKPIGPLCMYLTHIPKTETMSDDVAATTVTNYTLQSPRMPDERVSCIGRERAGCWTPNNVLNICFMSGIYIYSMKMNAF